MTENEIISTFNEFLVKYDMRAGVATICTLLKQLKLYKYSTIAELSENLRSTSKLILQNDDVIGTACISSTSELFQRHITLENEVLEASDFEEVQSVLVEKGEQFLDELLVHSRKKIVQLSLPFINDGVTILTHSKSSTVEQVLSYAKDSNKNFNVFVTQSMPNESGSKMVEILKEKNIPAIMILDAAVTHVMDQVDIVLLGAEGIAANGGLINKIGTYQICMAAKYLNKPVYVVAEKIKFNKIFPLNQEDVQKSFGSSQKDKYPRVDYTPPDLVDLLITDLGVLTPSSVTEVRFKLQLN